MKNKLLKLLTILMVLSFSLGTLLACSNGEDCAGEKRYSKGLQFVLINNDTEYEVAGIGTCTDIELIIPSSYEGKPVTSIGYNAFITCRSLISIEIPNSVTNIGVGAFSYCTSLTSIEIPSSVTSIVYECFSYSTSLASVKIPNSVTSIGDRAFDYCTSLTSIEIPNSVISIGNAAFTECRSLGSAEIPNSVTSIGDHAFSFCRSLESIEIPNSVTSIGVGAFSFCTSLKNIAVSVENTAYKSIDGNLYSKDGKELKQYAIGKKSTSFIIPNTVTSIGDCAFSYCTSLTSIEIPNSVTSIGYNAFTECRSLKGIIFNGTIVEWDIIEKGDLGAYAVPVTYVQCDDGIVELN